MLNIEDDFIHRGLRCVVARVNAPYFTHRVAYVGVRPGHPLHSVGYNVPIPKTEALLEKALSNSVDDIGIINVLCAGNPDDEDFLTPSLLLSCHRGITYSGAGTYPISSIADLWWFGFDTAHDGDDRLHGGQPFDYVRAQCCRLADQLADMQP